MNSNFISRALCFHGQPMQKIWEDERGAGNLQQCGIPAQPDYSIYQERQKYFTFQDRAKRLKLHQFFARKAPDLYDAELTSNKVKFEKLVENEAFVSSLPPYELFVNKNKDKQKRWRCVLEAIKPGDIIYCMVTKSGLTTGPSIVKPLCTGEPLVRYLNDIPIKAYLQHSSNTKTALENNGKPRGLNTHDLVCSEVLEISVDAERIYLGLDSVNEKNENITLGVITEKELPKYYREINECKLGTFEEHMLKSKEFLNPNYDILYEIAGLDVHETYTFMTSLKCQFPRDEYAKDLRRTQASKWAFRSVAEGIEHFKNGHHVEAFQCLNKALNIDPRNVEGLVARGALYANKGSFLKAVDDFEKALKLNAYHVNARKYMGETLVALGRRYEDENRIEDATKAYQDCLNIIPNHEQARLSLEAIQQRTGSQYFDNVLNVPGEADEVEKDKISQHHSSSDEGTTSSGSGTGSDTGHSDNEENDKEESLSPLSKRMALHSASLQKEEESKKQLNQPFYMTTYNVPPDPVAATKNLHEFRLDDDDTGSRVRKLLQEASKHKKEKKKTKKKKSKKSKKVSRKEKNAAAILSKINFQDAYKAISSMNIENKLNENLQRYEKTIAEIKKRQHDLVQSIEAGMSKRERSETPPPRAPSMRLPDQKPSSYAGLSMYPAYPSTSIAATATIADTLAIQNEEPAKLSFQIKRPVKVDKFGLVRIATPLAQKSPTPRSRSHTPRERRRRSRSRQRSRSRGRRHSRRRSRTRSRSVSRGGGRRRASRRSRSISPHHISRRTRSRSHSRPGRSRRSSPGGHAFGRGVYRGGVTRQRTPPSRRRSISPLNDGRRNRPFPKRGGRGAGRGGVQFGNRVWRRDEPRSGVESNGRWQHDKFSEDAVPQNKADDGPSIEEIDEIINKAQKERKQEIINRDKDILKKSTGGQF